MVLYVDLSRAIWKGSGTPQHSTASKIGIMVSSRWNHVILNNVITYLNRAYGIQVLKTWFLRDANNDRTNLKVTDDLIILRYVTFEKTL